MNIFKMKIKDCVLIEPFKCSQDESVVDVARRLREITLRHIFVVDENEYPVGIISMMDVNNRVVAEGKNPSEVKAKDIMTASIDVADHEDETEEFSKKMLEKNHVMDPVVEDGKIIGIITINQLLKSFDKNE